VDFDFLKLISGLRRIITRTRSADGKHSLLIARRFDESIYTNRKSKKVPSLQHHKHPSHLTRHPHPAIKPQHNTIQHNILNTLRNELCELVWLSGSHFLLLAPIQLVHSTSNSNFEFEAATRRWKKGMGTGEKKNLRGNSITLVKLARTLSLIIAVILESNILGAIVTTRMP
jgi:hypothetical protein